MGMFSIGISIEDGLYSGMPSPYRRPQVTMVDHLENAGLSFEEAVSIISRVISRRYLDAVILDHCPTLEDIRNAESLHGPGEVRPRRIDGMLQ